MPTPQNPWPSMSVPDPLPLSFDDVVIDFAGRRLLRGGVPQPLEPKAFAVLALLAGAPGRAFSRDDILDAVWGHRHVTPGVLNRVMTLLRHALGEEANAPRYLRTLHGVGYRFDLPASTADMVDNVPGDEPPRRRASDHAETTAPRRRAAVWTVAVGLVLAITAVLWWRSPPGDPGARPADANLAAGPVLAVLPLRAVGDDPRGQAFADGLSEELISLLARIDGLRVTSYASSFQLRGSALPRSEVARRLHATHLLEGSVRQDGERLRITLRLIQADGERSLWSQDYDRELRDIFAIQDSIARSVGSALQLRLNVGARPQPGPGEDPQLHHRYLLARGANGGHAANPRQAGLEAERALRDMVADHPGYARAWGGLGVTLWMLALRPAPERWSMRQEAERAAATALRLDPRQADAHAVLAAKACNEQRWSDCLALSRRAVALAPSDSIWRNWHANRLATVGYVNAALREIEQAQAIDPLVPVHNFTRGRLLDTLGRHDEARTYLMRADPSLSPTAIFFNALWRGDRAAARRAVEALPQEVPWRASELAALDAMARPERWPEVMRLIEANEAMAKDGMVPYDFTRLLLPQRDYARDIDGLDGVQREGYASYQLVFWQPESQALRRHPAFQAYLRRSGLLAFWREHGWPDVCRSDGRDGAVCD
ncbi:winged helix-turn-helix domain-containing protein [Luteimonas sp. SX5]|uniref:Winged helix-turn-helix domain-containing protein n=1 Tax=Luteimonas galliterrae TaxID=2940486 RepID=A0ABT0MM73_9GAMM|nr:winged helix-turn-helix domain-containing protein [Luteimonas galliterrae]MCL1635976.1 winged helix-turn-helix domain-containing protein [Luteimonas galliterrae]